MKVRVVYSSVLVEVKLEAKEEEEEVTLRLLKGDD
jgi:hypothetical protein